MRETHELGLRELAAKVGTTALHMSRTERAKRRATPEVMQRICGTIARWPA